jgi:hypothetical protein
MGTVYELGRRHGPDGASGSTRLSDDAGQDLDELSSRTELWAELTSLRGDLFGQNHAITELCRSLSTLIEVVERQGERIADLQADLAHRDLEMEIRS